MNMNIKINPVDMEEVAKLERFLDGQMYCAASSNARGREIAVVIPYGSKRGWKLFYQAVRQFARSAWRELR